MINEGLRFKNTKDFAKMIKKSNCSDINSILQNAAFYEINNNEHLYESLQELRKRGGTIAIKAFWYKVRVYVERYKVIIENEFKNRILKIVFLYLFLTSITNITLLLLLI